MKWESLLDNGQDATDETIAQVIRAWRDDQLIQSDWTMLNDAPVDQNAWAQYRKELRDMTSNQDPKSWIFPVRP